MCKNLKPGDIILKKYKIESNLSDKGGMGVIYLARNLTLGSKVIVKQLKKNMWESKSLLHRFEEEAKTQSNINHPGIVKVFDYDVDNLCIIMEYISGKELQSFIDSDLKTKVKLFLKILKPLIAAHENGIVHRDIKPSNIFVTNDNYVKIADFGIAKKLGEENSQQTILGIGTPTYMSPEQLRGETITQRSDIYSLGVVMYLLVFKTLPSEGETILIKPDSKDMPSGYDENPYIPEKLEQIILKCIERNPSNRYKSVVDLQKDLVEFDNTHSYETKSDKKKPQLIYILAAAISIVLLFIFIYFFSSKEKTIPKTQEQTASEFSKSKLKDLPVSNNAENIINREDKIVDKVKESGHRDLAYENNTILNEQKENLFSGPVLQQLNDKQNLLLEKFNDDNFINDENKIKEIFKLKIGLNISSEEKFESDISNLIVQENNAILTKNGYCDEIISISNIDSMQKINVSSIFYDNESFTIKNPKDLESRISSIINRDYCFNILNILKLINNNSKDQVKLALFDENKTKYKVGEIFKLNMTPYKSTYCILLNINLSGAALLFPWLEKQDNLLGAYEEYTTDVMEVYPPVGNEMIIAISTIYDLLSSAYNFTENQPFFQWRFNSTNKADSATVLCENILFKLLGMSKSDWSSNALFIETYQEY